MSAPIVIAAGGTGGHFFPAEALASALMARGERVVLLTDTRSGWLNSAVFARAECHVLAGAGLSGRSALRALKGVLALAQGTVQARKILTRLKPGAVVAFGGYPAVAPVLAARLLAQRPRILLHEQNAVLGRANRLLARMADLLVLSFTKTSAIPAGVKTVLLGNPVRPAITALQGEGYAPPAERINLLVLGGSLGAKIFGTLIPEALALLPAPLRARLALTQQCRAQEHDAAAKTLADAGIAAELSPFFADVAQRLASAHLVIARSGASTVAELAVAARPAIFIPLPGAIDDHQRANADALADISAAWPLNQAGLTPQTLAAKIESILMDPNTLQTAAAAAATAGRADAAARLADLVQKTIESGAAS
ncbi:MAG: undecaprenyldiphospho-muramoylpentapeptide beta-N-acetylglucosaminyltransferase [Acidocella sp. 20-63-7]|nr:MAG: undecaprenyldiphospho-muramoylpentapeptide beta-N-acetylglucosaminyltransferase [Acidocella sp. 20-63-7]HQT45831.1 undecaprenyldiphospho-muramoylpentapeptide beta-N-acetylglucosaminyltransferase [Acidocella sp.]